MPLHRDIHWIGKQWAVTGHGMQLIDQQLKGFFDIEAARLCDDTLIETVRAKQWLNVADFEKGLEVARKRFPASVVTPSSPPKAVVPVQPVASTADQVAQPAPPKKPVARGARLVVSDKPVAWKPVPAPAPIAKPAEPPSQEPAMVEPTPSTPGILQM